MANIYYNNMELHYDGISSGKYIAIFNQVLADFYSDYDITHEILIRPLSSKLILCLNRGNSQFTIEPHELINKKPTYEIIELLKNSCLFSDKDSYTAEKTITIFYNGQPVTMYENDWIEFIHSHALGQITD